MSKEEEEYDMRSQFHLRTNPEGPPAVLLNPLTCAVQRSLLNQLSLELRLALEAFGANDGFDFRFSSNTRMVVYPIWISFGGFAAWSRNRSLFGFFLLGSEDSTADGGVGSRVTGSAFKISSGRRAGRAFRRLLSCVVEP